jgi:ubiquinone/menaquinone biosynthesis C-methylase UbiE
MNQTQQAASTKTQTPTRALHLWHLLSLDAPTVATLWTWFAARTVHQHLPASGLAAMFIAVWMLYAADRLLDARQLFADPLHTANLEARHLFHHRHATAFLAGILFSSLALAILLRHIPLEVLRLYAILGSLVFAWFLLIHARATTTHHRLPKEIAVGIAFPAAIFIPTVARDPSLRLTLLPHALLFAAVCSLNCLCIYAWEHPASSDAHWTTRYATRHLTALATTTTLAGLTLTIITRQPLAAAATLSAATLLTLHLYHHHLTPLTARAAADLALLTPILFLQPYAALSAHLSALSVRLPKPHAAEESAEPNFNRIAKPYQYLEYLTLGPALQNCRTHFIPSLLNQKNALILGDGDGRFTAQLLQANPALQATAVDTSSTMLTLLEARNTSHATRLTTHQANALTFTPTHHYDLIVTHFFLDCLTQPDLEALIHRLTPSLQPNALWLISDFRIPTGPMHLPARLLVRSLYLAFRVLTGLRTTRLPDHATPLTAAGFTQIDGHLSLAGLLTTQLWQRIAPQSTPTKESMPVPAPKPHVIPSSPHEADPIPPSEPPVPSLDEPDPGVFHHEPAAPPD